MSTPSDSGVIFAASDWRQSRKLIGIKDADRRRHMYILGKTGTGKSTLIRNIIVNDIRCGQGLTVLDPHGDLIDSIIDCIPAHRANDVVLFDPADVAYPVGFNILESVDPALRSLVASHFIAVMKNIWEDMWGPRLEWILFNTAATLLDYEGSTLLAIEPLLTNPLYRARVLHHVKDPQVRQFWSIYEGWSEDFRQVAISPIQNKIGQFLVSAPIRHILGQVKSTFSFEDIMNNRKILLVNLSKGRLGEEIPRLLGSLVVTKQFLTALKRVNQLEHERVDHHLFTDECQNLASSIFAEILSEARKYRLNLVLTNQYFSQIPPKIRQAILGNVGSLVVFRIGSEDAEVLEPEFRPELAASDLEGLDRHQIYLKLAVDGMTSRPFSARTLAPAEIRANEGNRASILTTARQRYAIPRDAVEEKITRYFMNLERLQAEWVVTQSQMKERERQRKSRQRPNIAS